MSSDRKRFRPIHYLFGLMMGFADIIPGVSGGTVALIVGIYEALVGSIRGIAQTAISLLRGQRIAARRAFAEVEWPFLLLLGAGIATGLVIGGRVILPLMERYPVHSRALFFGLIAASVRVPWGRIRTRTAAHLGICAVATLLALLLTGVPPREVLDPSPLVIFLAAAVAICAMILPGISGAFVLLVLGLYQPTLRALNALDFGYVAIFVLGAAIGLGAFSKVLGKLLRTRHDGTMAALVGLMLGSLRALWPYQDEARMLLPPPSAGSFAIVTAIAFAGFAIVLFLTRFSLLLEARQKEAEKIRH